MTPVTIKEIQKIVPTWSKSTISRNIQQLRDALDRPKPKVVSVDEFCDYFSINFDK